MSRPNYEILSAYLDGQLTGEERLRAERLLKEDAEARRLLDELREVSHAVAGLPRHTLPSEFASEIEASLAVTPRKPHVDRAEPAEKVDWKYLRRRFLSGRSLAWAVVVLFVALGLNHLFPDNADQGRELALDTNTVSDTASERDSEVSVIAAGEKAKGDAESKEGFEKTERIAKFSAAPEMSARPDSSAPPADGAKSMPMLATSDKGVAPPEGLPAARSYQAEDSPAPGVRVTKSRSLHANSPVPSGDSAMEDQPALQEAPAVEKMAAIPAPSSGLGATGGAGMTYGPLKGSSSGTASRMSPPAPGHDLGLGSHDDAGRLDSSGGISGVPLVDRVADEKAVAFGSTISPEIVVVCKVRKPAEAAEQFNRLLTTNQVVPERQIVFEGRSRMADKASLMKKSEKAGGRPSDLPRDKENSASGVATTSPASPVQEELVVEVNWSQAVGLLKAVSQDKRQFISVQADATPRVKLPEPIAQFNRKKTTDTDTLAEKKSKSLPASPPSFSQQQTEAMDAYRRNTQEAQERVQAAQNQVLAPMPAREQEQKPLEGSLPAPATYRIRFIFQ